MWLGRTKGPGLPQLEASAQPEYRLQCSDLLKKRCRLRKKYTNARMFTVRKNVPAIRNAGRATGLIASMTYSFVRDCKCLSMRFHLAAEIEDEAVSFA